MDNAVTWKKFSKKSILLGEKNKQPLSLPKKNLTKTKPKNTTPKILPLKSSPSQKALWTNQKENTFLCPFQATN